tara:strand:+ start:3521 stop:3844 length:324 start_codon:yes stop_codon:yes gene_type:complete
MKKPLHRLPLDEWFDDVPHPYDSWPMATNKDDTDYPPLDRNGESVYPPRPEEEAADIHQKMYEMATARYNPFHVGGSENAQSEIDYVKKHSPWPGGGSEEWHDNKPG